MQTALAEQAESVERLLYGKQRRCASRPASLAARRDCLALNLGGWRVAVRRRLCLFRTAVRFANRHRPRKDSRLRAVVSGSFRRTEVVGMPSFAGKLRLERVVPGQVGNLLEKAFGQFAEYFPIRFAAKIAAQIDRLPDGDAAPWAVIKNGPRAEPL